MPRSRRDRLETVRETETPPDTLEPNNSVAQVTKILGKNLYTVKLPSGDEIIVEMPARFRSTIWMKLRGYVVVDTSVFEDRENKIHGEIVNIVREEKIWRKMPYWPAEFPKKNSFGRNYEGSNVGEMPPIEDSDKEEAGA